MSPAPVSSKRARDIGVPLPGVTGAHNALTDIPGVEVGYTTLIQDHPVQVRTGVTAILPRGHQSEPQPVWAGIHAFNGNGEMTGSHWIEDGGYFLGPVCITNTHSVGAVHHAAVRWIIDSYSRTWTQNHLWAMPVVAETYDGSLNDINGQHVTEAHARAAMDSAHTGVLAEGNVGGGTGMIAYGYKGGTGTASRLVEVADQSFTVAALVQANHGIRPWFSVLGVPVGLLDAENPAADRERGSIIVVLATDAPMAPHQLRRLARRGSIGIGRGGTVGGNGSGDIFLAFSTANAGPMPELARPRLTLDYVNDEYFDVFYEAAVQSVEESVLNAMLAADPCPYFRPRAGTCEALDADRLMQLLRSRHRID